MNFDSSNTYDLKSRAPVGRKAPRWLVFTLVLVAALAGSALADLLHYNPVNAAVPVSASYPNALGGDWTTPVDPQPTNGGDPTINVQPLFSDASATVAVEVGLYHRSSSGTYTLMRRVRLGTLAAASADVATIGTGTWYLGEGVGLDSRAATHYDVRPRGAPSAGSVAFLRWTHGASGEPR